MRKGMGPPLEDVAAAGKEWRSGKQKTLFCFRSKRIQHFFAKALEKYGTMQPIRTNCLLFKKSQKENVPARFCPALDL
ncbi:MAG: hypothetical protein K1Y36_06355 [Blastocatellia bacterium]|nr:hypothetical protein [Blastocatellia bacterium]